MGMRRREPAISAREIWIKIAVKRQGTGSLPFDILRHALERSLGGPASCLRAGAASIPSALRSSAVMVGRMRCADPKHVVCRGKTPFLTEDQARRLIEWISTAGRVNQERRESTSTRSLLYRGQRQAP